jgi:hypothetical protein
VRSEYVKDHIVINYEEALEMTWFHVFTRPHLLHSCTFDRLSTCVLGWLWPVIAIHVLHQDGHLGCWSSPPRYLISIAVMRVRDMTVALWARSKYKLRVVVCTPPSSSFSDSVLRVTFACCVLLLGLQKFRLKYNWWKVCSPSLQSHTPPRAPASEWHAHGYVWIHCISFKLIHLARIFGPNVLLIISARRILLPCHEYYFCHKHSCRWIFLP